MGKDKFMYLKNKVLTGNEHINDNIRVENTDLYKIKNSFLQTKGEQRNNNRTSPKAAKPKVEIKNF